jgi:hypothetical protein
MRTERLRLIAPAWLSLMTLAPLAAPAEVIVNGRPSVVLEGPAAKLVIDLGGGSIVDFHLAAGGLNPLRWIGPADESVVLRPMAHFVCLDRWGQPSEAELRNGMPYHGEAARVRWQEFNAPEATDGRIIAAMGATLPLAGLEIRRTVRLSQTAALFSVSETVTNRNKLGRMYNIVQHATIGPPFLDEATVVDSNAQRGFVQSNPMPNPEQPETRWPEASKQSRPVDLRHLTNDPDPNVVSFVVDDEIGWVTATNSSKELLIGYIWRTADYPWLNIWRHVANGKPLARGMEFGTTGLPLPFAALISKPGIFGRPTFTYLDAGENSTRSYAAFLVKVPRDFRGAESVRHSGSQLVIHERGGGRELKIPADRLFQ